MTDTTNNPKQIERGSDLTDADIDLLAHDMADMARWGIPRRLSDTDLRREMSEAIKARLGRHDLVLNDGK